VARATNCKLCKYGQKCSNLWGRGNKKADIMIVVDCVTRGCHIDDKIAGGDLGEKLKYLLKEAKIKYKDVYITSAIKCKVDIPSSIKPKELNECRGHLFSEILSVRPKLIIAMGKSAHQAITDKTSVYEYRGHFDTFSLEYDSKISSNKATFNCSIMPTYSPFTSLTKWEQDIYLIHDLKKSKKYIKTGELPKVVMPKFKTVLSRKGLREFKKWALASKKLWVDFETTGLLFHRHAIINAGYCNEKGEVYIIYHTPFPKEATEKFNEGELARVDKINTFIAKNKNLIKKITAKVHASDIPKIGHNLKFDAKFAMYHGVPLNNWYFDTVIADALIDENCRHDLNACMEFRGINFGAYDTNLHQYIGKEKKKPFNHIPPHILEQYLAIDVYGDRRLYKKQIKELKQEGLYKFMFERQMPLIRELTLMEYEGHKVDIDRLKEAHEQLNVERDELLIKLRKKAKSDDFNPNSSEQVGALLEERGYPFERFEVKRGKKGFYSTSEGVLEKFMQFKKWKELPEMILRYRKIIKYNSTFIYGPIEGSRKEETGLLPLIDKDGFVHTNYNAHTPRTGRLSSSEPNLQNIPRESESFPSVRQFYIPPFEDWATFEADYQALEVAVSAMLSGDKLLIKLLKDGTDMHTYNMVHVGKKLGMVKDSITYEKFKKFIDFKPKDPDNLTAKDKKKLKRKKKYKGIRFLQKAVTFGLNYGQSPVTLARDLERSREEMEQFVDEYFTLYDGVFNWREDIKEEALTTGILTLSTGRKRRFTYAIKWLNSPYASNCGFKAKMLKEEIIRQALNFPVQGEANEIYTGKKLKLIEAMREKNLQGTIRLTIHDGFVGNAPKKELAKIRDLCKNILPTKVEAADGSDLLLDLDFNANTHWYGDSIEV
jgi:uracil-DNA glycosylase family 4